MSWTFGGQADLHDPAGRGEGLQHHRHARRLRQLGDGELQALLHALPRIHEVGAHLEEQHHLRQCRATDASGRLDARHAAQRVLHRNRDQFLDLGGGHARAFGLDLDLGRRELGEHVDRHLAQLRTPNTNSVADGDHQEAESQARADDPGKHPDAPHARLQEFLLGPSNRGRPKADAFEQALCQYAMRLNQKRFSSYGLRPRVTPA